MRAHLSLPVYSVALKVLIHTFRVHHTHCEGFTGIFNTYSRLHSHREDSWIKLKSQLFISAGSFFSAQRRGRDGNAGSLKPSQAKLQAYKAQTKNAIKQGKNRIRMTSNAEFSCFSLASTEQRGGGCYLHVGELLRRQHVVLISQQRQDATQYALHILYLTK